MPHWLCAVFEHILECGIQSGNTDALRYVYYNSGRLPSDEQVATGARLGHSMVVSFCIKHGVFAHFHCRALGEGGCMDVARKLRDATSPLWVPHLCLEGAIVGEHKGMVEWILWGEPMLHLDACFLAQKTGSAKMLEWLRRKGLSWRASPSQKRAFMQEHRFHWLEPGVCSARGCFSAPRRGRQWCRRHELFLRSTLSGALQDWHLESFLLCH